MENTFEKLIELDSVDHMMNLFGNYDENIQIIEDAFGIRISTRDEAIRLSGKQEDVEKAEKIIRRLATLASRG